MNNRVRSAVKLDFYTVKASMRTSVIMLVIAVIVGLATRMPLFSIMFTMVFVVLIGGMVFQAHEKAGSGKLYGILPLKKSEMIAGRYLYALAVGAIGLVIACIIGIIITLILKQPLNMLVIGSYLAIGFAYFGFAVGVSYPIYLKFSFAKAYVFTMLPMYLIVIIVVFVYRSMSRGGSINASQITQFISDYGYLIPIIGAVVGLAFLAISAAIANLIYTQKEI